MRRMIVLGALVAVGTVSMALHAQQAGPKEIKVQSLNVSDNLYVLSGGGGHTLALTIDSGVVLVDTKLAGWGKTILDVIQDLTDKPVTTIINTHTHGDHNGSNAELGASVTEIVTHRNTKTNMEKMDAFKGANAKFLPNKTFDDKLTLLDGIDRIDLYYFGRGHTDGDAVVVFPAKRIAHMGDLFPAKMAPLIDTRNGGSGVEYPETLAKAAAALASINPRIVTGHGPLPPGSPIGMMTNIKDLQEYADFNRDFLEAVRAAHKAGKSVDEAMASLNLPERYKSYTMDRAKTNVETIYKELSR